MEKYFRERQQHEQDTKYQRQPDVSLHTGVQGEGMRLPMPNIEGNSVL